VGDCYKPDTDEVVFVSEKCPLKEQNFDYAMFLLTAIYNESWKHEAWEKLITEEDMKVYIWQQRKSKETVVQLLTKNKQIEKTSTPTEEQRLQHIPEDCSEEALLEVKEVKDYADAVTNYMNNGESQEAIENYGGAVRKLLGIKGGLQAASSS